MSYDAADNSAKSYTLAVHALRMEGLRSGKFKPLDVAEQLIASGKAKDYRRFGPHTLYNGDCKVIAPEVGLVDSVLTDPPYGDADTHAQHLSSITLRNGEPAGQVLGFEGISAEDLLQLATEWCAASARRVVFSCEWKHVHKLDEAGLLVRFGIWRKPDGAPQFTGDRPGTGWEAVAICHRPGRKRWNGGGQHAFWSVPKGGKHGHPTEKPIGLLSAWVRDFTDPGEIVLDPFMGSGTTGEACQRYGRRFVGIERNPDHFATACRRIEQAMQQPDLFIETPKPAVQESLAL